MYKKVIFCSLLASVLSHCASDLTTWLEVKPGYFFFSSSPLKNIYKKGGFSLQASASIPMCHYLDLYTSVGYRRTTGKSLGAGEKTQLSVVPIDIGLKPIVNVYKYLYYFFACGPRYFYINQHNKSSYVDCRVHGSGLGLFVNTGFTVLLVDHLLLGLFGEYAYEKKKNCPKAFRTYSNGRIQTSGAVFGISLGYAF